MTSENASIFSYNLTRPYPYRWVTPVIFIGSIAALALFSFLNYVSTGIQQKIEYVTDPNKTIAEGQWLNKWPSYFTNQVKPTCQSLEIDVNSNVFTNQTGLTYSLTSVQQQHSNGTLGGLASSLTYLNNPIQNCSINAIQIDLEAEDRSASQYAFTMWGPSVLAFISCTIETDSGRIIFNLTSTYDFVPPTAGMPKSRNYAPTQTFSFLKTDAQTKGSLWWGESLLSMYWVHLSWQMELIRARSQEDALLRKGTMYFQRYDTADPVQDITDLGFWDIDYRFLTNKNSSEDMIYPGNTGLDGGNQHSIASLSAAEARPNVWIASDGLVKSFYSAIMTDLGQTSTGPNILLNTTALEYYTRNFSAIRERTANAIPGPGVLSYTEATNATGPLGTTPAVFSTKYLCQVPRQKSTGSIIFSVLVADIVFLQLLWKIFTLATDWYLLHTKPEANRCASCTGQNSFTLLDLAATPGTAGNETHEENQSSIAKKRVAGSTLIERRQAYTLMRDSD